jgi:hypothetical protein
MKLPKILSSRNNNLNLLKTALSGLKNYFIGILLMPWIWNFGFFGIQTLFVQFYLSRPDLERINTSLIATFNKQIIIWDVWKLVLFLLIGNYTISFFVRQKQPKLSIILFLTTLLILFYMASLSIPFFRESIRND